MCTSMYVKSTDIEECRGTNGQMICTSFVYESSMGLCVGLASICVLYVCVSDVTSKLNAVS